MKTFDAIIENIKLLIVAIASTIGIDVKAIMYELSQTQNNIFLSDTIIKPLIAFVFVKLLDYTLGKKINLILDKLKKWKI